MVPFELLKYEVKDFIAAVTLNRPPVNALNRTLVSELAQVADIVTEEVRSKRVRVVVLRAEGKHFCAGADLKERAAMREEEIEPRVQRTREALDKIARLPVPVIAAVQGSALGGGWELALAADLRLLAESARVGLPEVTLAIMPGAGGTQRLARLIGYSDAMLWICTGRVFTAQEALQYGAAHFVVKDDELWNKALALATEIANNGPIAVQQAKKALQLGLETDLRTGLQWEGECYRAVIPTKDRLEGLKAFAEKREPKYTGE